MADAKINFSPDSGTPIVNTKTAPQPEPVRQQEVGTFTRFAIRCVAAILGIGKFTNTYGIAVRGFG